MRRHRHAKIIATLGPATKTPADIRDLFVAGADVFRLNFSHGTSEEHRRRIEIIRALERETGRPVGILLDLQGPKLRIGRLAGGRAELSEGGRFRLDSEPTPGDASRVCLPHPEIFAALAPGADLLIDDGKIHLHVESCATDHARTVVRAGGVISDHKGVNVPGVVLPLSPFTEKDHRDLDFGLAQGVDWIAASFVQRPEDVDLLRERVGGEAAIMTKLEKPAAVDRLAEIIDRSDGVMVARGDLGVELPPERVPSVQKRIVRDCREAGKPVVVATQMLESMINVPVPTRAEASDVATAVYDGADAVMLSAETATGRYPRESVEMMDRILRQIEQDPFYRQGLDASLPTPQANTADAICEALRSVTHTLPVAVTVTFTSSGFSSLRAARERPDSPIVSITPNIHAARRLCLVWGIHSVQGADIRRVQEMVDTACAMSVREDFAKPGDTLIIMAGMPFGQSGTTNLLRIAEIPSAT